MCKILSRINQIISEEGITIPAFEKRIGASRGVISKAIKNGTDIQSKWLSLICDNFPRYSPEWILTGNGDMIRNRAPEPSTNLINRPRIPFDAAAGSLTDAVGMVKTDDCEQIPVIPTFPRYDFTIIARGNSMEPQYLSGDELACRFVTESSFIQWGRAHVLDTAQGIVVKRIFDSGDHILCKSNNPNYPDFTIPKTEIYRIAMVVGYIRIE